MVRLMENEPDITAVERAMKAFMRVSLAPAPAAGFVLGTSGAAGAEEPAAGFVFGTSGAAGAEEPAPAAGFVFGTSGAAGAEEPGNLSSFSGGKQSGAGFGAEGSEAGMKGSKGKGTNKGGKGKGKNSKSKPSCEQGRTESNRSADGFSFGTSGAAAGGFVFGTSSTAPKCFSFGASGASGAIASVHKCRGNANKHPAQHISFGVVPAEGFLFEAPATALIASGFGGMFGGGTTATTASPSLSQGVDNAADKARLTALYTAQDRDKVRKIDGILAKRTTQAARDTMWSDLAKKYPSFFQGESKPTAAAAAGGALFGGGSPAACGGALGGGGIGGGTTATASPLGKSKMWSHKMMIGVPRDDDHDDGRYGKKVQSGDVDFQSKHYSVFLLHLLQQYLNLT